MGQTYCQNTACCLGDKNQLQDLSSFQKPNDHKPLPTFAVPVRQILELNPVVREIYNSYRSTHLPERCGAIREPCYYLFNYAAYYEGQWKYGLPHGHGKLVYDDGSLYEGCFKQGFADCRQAIYITNQGNFYRGQVLENKAHGEGELYTNKFYFKGCWKEDLPEGPGKEIYSQTSFYEGNFVGGRKEGEGIYQWGPNHWYRGGFKGNLMEGNGQIHMKEFIYEGQFQKGLKQGQGKLVHLKQQWMYEGSFKADQMEGLGVYSWKDGTMFEGRFHRNQKTNEGRLVLPDGRIVQCEDLA